MSLHKFYFDAITLARTNQWRYGQAMFNHLLTVRPDMAEEIRGSNRDPFYCTSPNDERFDNFISYLEHNWYEPMGVSSYSHYLKQ